MSLETNIIYCGDCKEVLKTNIPDKSIDLIYLDPPFFSNRTYEIIWGNGAELRAFEDRWKGGIEYYVGWMEERLEVCKDVLKDTGSIYLHCDRRANAHLRIAMDKIFGPNHFKNEIVWCYRGGGVSKTAFARKHDTIFFYTKGKKGIFNPQYVAYSEASQKLVKSKGGKSIDGKKRDLKRGAHMPDWWTDINSLQTWSPERVGYPTQKPEPLAARIIKTSSNEGDVVLDPFCGGGTTTTAAHKLGRKWIGIDVSPVACRVMKERMEGLEGILDVPIIGGPVSLKDTREYSPQEFQKWACERIGGKSKTKKVSDMGIDGYTRERTPISVKQSSRIGRNVVDNFETAIKRDKKNRGIIISYSFTKGAYEEVARARSELDIKLVKAEDITDHSIDGDELFS